MKNMRVKFLRGKSTLEKSQFLKNENPACCGLGPEEIGHILRSPPAVGTYTMNSS